MAESLSDSAMGRALERDRATVRRWRQAGCPADLAGAVRWLEERAGRRAAAPLEARRRKRAAEAQLAELELSIRRAEHVPATDVDHGYVTLASVAQQRILGVPAAIALELAAESTPSGCQSILQRELHQALSDLAESGREAAGRIAARDGGSDAERDGASGGGR